MVFFPQQVLRKLGVGSPTSPLVSHDNSLARTKLSTSSPIAGEDDHHHGDANSSNHDNSNHSNSDSNNSKNTKMGNGHIGGTKPSVVPDPKLTSGLWRRKGSNPNAAVIAELRKSRMQAEQLAQDLARAKLEYAETMASMEQKKMEARQALLRESQAVREVDAAQSYITVLEQRVSCSLIRGEGSTYTGNVSV